MATSIRRRGELELVVINGAKAARDLDKVAKANLGVAKSAEGTTKATTLQQQATSLLTGKISGLVATLGAAAAGYVSLQGAKKLMAWGEEAAKVRDLANAFEGFNKTAGRTANQTLSELRKAVQGTISDAELMQRSNLLMMLDVPMERVGDIAQIARNAALATGQDVSYMMESLSVALARQSKLWLDNLGIIVSADKANASYAASVGKTVDALTDEEKKLAFINAALDSGMENIKRSGNLLVGEADPYARLNASAKNLSLTLKDTLVPATSAVAESLAAMLVSTDGIVTRVTGFWSDPSARSFILAAIKAAELVQSLPGVPNLVSSSPGVSYRVQDAFSGVGGPSESRDQYNEKMAARDQRRRYAEIFDRLARRLDELDAKAEQASILGGAGKFAKGRGASGDAAELLTTFEKIDVDKALENIRYGFETFEEFLTYKDAIGEAAGGIYTMANAFEYLSFQTDNYASVATESLAIAASMYDRLGEAYANLWLGQKKAFPEAMKLIAKEAQARIAAVAAVAAIDALKYTYQGIAAMASGLTFGQASGFFVAAAKAAAVAGVAGAAVAGVGGLIGGSGGAGSGAPSSVSGGGVAGGNSGLGGQTRDINVTRTAPTTVTITHNYFGPVSFGSQAVSDAAAIQEAIDGGDVLIPESEVA